ncbi:uncharacterized protein LOC142341355 [Convolutriloba macropyga]|uniref:uncharacterized protein LOC142341355 n=1 Tax=Convolutriloba macropyga TaxID=536237 RepID=UPI003F5242FE
MTSIEIPRCLIPSTNGTHQLHTFTDASMSAIAAIVYVRTTNADGSSTSRYVISKTKVAPIKQLSIPKLELEAATLGAELAGFCESEMTITISSKHFWTDSTATLGWIKSKQRQKMYIANRLTKIHENSNQENWRHIPGKMNPADHGTQGLTPSDIPKMWLQPPDFLSKPQDSWNFAEGSDPHICATQATQLQTPVIEVDKFSTWSRLLNSTRMVLQAIRRFRAKVRTRRQNESPETSNTNIFASDENKARNYLIKMSQNELFSGTISALLKGGNLEKGDKLMPFTPFLDEDGLLRVGGRLNKAPLTYNAKHPLLLHSRSKIARLLIEKAHHDCGHQGVEHVKAHLQQTFLMIGLRKVLRSLGKYCFICRRWRADNVRPKMADLPEFRFPDANKQYPFVNTGMDMFGPFFIEDKREGTQMHYVCLFTCLVTRAVHLEVCHDLSTDCLLMTIRRFVSRRGYPDLIVSDNGKNFIGANQAMKLKFKRSYKPDNEYIRLQLAQQNIQWTFNPPLAPHFGGVWERLIQTAKRSLLIVLGSRKLTLSVFQTVVAEAEAILNSRPLTHVGCSISDEGPLTPNHLLLRRPHMCLKPLVNSNQRFSTKDFKLTQTLLDHYWSRLLKEYVPELKKRTKWQRSHDELDEGEIVWVLKEFTPRGIWPLGKFVKAHRGSDGIARSFDIQTATGMVQRPAVTLSRVFPQSSASTKCIFIGSDIACKLTSFFNFVLTVFPDVISAFVAVDRVVAICFGVWYRVHGTGRNALITVGTILATIVVLGAARLYFGEKDSVGLCRLPVLILELMQLFIGVAATAVTTILTVCLLYCMKNRKMASRNSSNSENEKSVNLALVINCSLFAIFSLAQYSLYSITGDNTQQQILINTSSHISGAFGVAIRAPIYLTMGTMRKLFWKGLKPNQRPQSARTS